MIIVQTHQTKGCFSLTIAGHAYFAKPGQDIVCAAVSAIIQTAILGLQAIAEKYPEHVKVMRGENDGRQQVDSGGD